MAETHAERGVCARTAGLAGLLVAMALVPTSSAWGVDGDAFNETFKLGPGKDYTVEQIACSIPANVLYPGDRPTFTFQVVNATDGPIRAKGKVDLMAYHTSIYPDDCFKRRFLDGRTAGSTPVAVDIAAGGFAHVDVKPVVPETFGAYALVFDIPGHGRQFATPLVRVAPPVPGKVQFPAFAIDLNGWNCYPETYVLFQRCGVKAIRQEIGFDPSDRYKNWLADLMRGLMDNDITLLITSAAGGPQPLGRPRKFLDDQDQFMDVPLQDMAWLPSADDDFQQWIEYLASNYGWPKGPVNAVELWNEPWEGNSISGWGADMLRYRELYTRMARGIEDARKKAGVQVLIGGCCSSMNTEDKLFCDGKDTFLKWLDFTSIHYQPMGAFPSLIPQWRNRQSPYGPVRVWDTESWIANSEEHISAVLAVMRAQGQSRTAGVLHGWTYDVIPTEVRQPDGTTQKAIVAVPWANAAAIAADQRLVGERTFREILFKNGLPWVFVFNGLPRNGRPDPDDATMVVVGDIGGNTERDRCRFRTVLGLGQVRRVGQLKEQLARLPADAPDEQRRPLKRQLIAAMYLDGASMTLRDPEGIFRAYDYYGNPVAPRRGRITLPLDISGRFLRTDGSPGSFRKLVAAVRAARVDGFQPVEIAARDLTRRIGRQPELHLLVTNVLNRPVSGRLTVSLGKLRLDDRSQRTLKLAAHETKDIALKVTAGRESPDNTYPLTATFRVGWRTKVTLREDMHVNVISRRTIAVDGNLADWQGALPQPVSSRGAIGRTLTEEAWRPSEKFGEHLTSGFATAYLACDDRCFYFAAKIADDTPFDGGVRYATRDDDQVHFFPEKCYEVRRDSSGKITRRTERVWPKGVRRFSYRKLPDLPSGSGTDNVQIAFGVFEPGANGIDAYPPGTMHRFMTWQCTDYEYALNRVSAKHGGRTEIWRLFAPGCPRKHFYPRQPKAPVDGGPVADGKLVMRRDGNVRLVEAAIPWTELAEVKKRLDAGRRVRFLFRVNDNKGAACESAAGRSISQMNSYALHNLWEGHWSNEIEFALEP